jgi:hypothetical protein
VLKRIKYNNIKNIKNNDGNNSNKNLLIKNNIVNKLKWFTNINLKIKAIK